MSKTLFFEKAVKVAAALGLRPPIKRAPSQLFINPWV